jgi:polar amino acid transport system substrate-binding protein
MRRLWLALSLVCLVVGAGCGSGAKPTVARGSTRDLRTSGSGELVVGSDVSYAPIEFFREGTQQVEGLDYELAQAIGAKLGRQVRFVNSTFDGLIPALRSRRFDVVMSAMSDTKEREGAGVDFVDYFNAGTAILVRRGNPNGIHALDDLCGKTVGLQRGTTQEKLARGEEPRCRATGHRLTVLAFDKDTDALQALKTGRSAADLNDFPVAAYNALTSGGGRDFEVVGSQFQVAPYGIAVPKDNPGLRDAIRGALQSVVDDGTYGRILRHWDVLPGALDTVTVNGGR